MSLFDAFMNAMRNIVMQTYVGDLGNATVDADVNSPKMLSHCDFSQEWEDLMYLEIPSRAFSLSDTSKQLVELLTTFFFDSKFAKLLIEKESDKEAVSIYIYAHQTSIISHQICGTTLEKQIEQIFNLINSCELLYDYSLDFYICLIESFGIVGNRGQSDAELIAIISILQKFLLGCHDIFAIYDKFHANVLAHATSHILVKLLEKLYALGYIGPLRTSILFSAINQLQSSHQLIQEKHADSSQNENLISVEILDNGVNIKDREFLMALLTRENNIVLLSHLSKVLSPADVIFD